jgi:hypothetical protein
VGQASQSKIHDGPSRSPSLPNQCSSRQRLPQEHSKSISRPIRSAVEGGEQTCGSKKIGATNGVYAAFRTVPGTQGARDLIRRRI